MTSLPTSPERDALITRREAIRRVSALLGGVALVGGTSLLTGCRDRGGVAPDAPFSAEDVAFLDEVADTILPTTKTPGAKAAGTGAFMALMVTDSYDAADRKVFREGMRKLDDATKKAHDVSFMQATTQQRLAVLQVLDREQHADREARKARGLERKRKARDASRPVTSSEQKASDAFLPDQRKENAPGTDAAAAPALGDEPPAHYFAMMKELALLGYFTSEIGCTRAQRYVESPGRFEPCIPLTPGDVSWAPHA